MSTEIIVAIIAFVGTLASAFLGGLMSSNVIKTRLDALEKKVDKHNNLIERMYKVEGRVDELCHDVEDLKRRN